MTRRHISARGFRVVAIDAEVHFIRVVIVEDDLLETIIEIVLRIDLLARGFATRSAGTAAAPSRLALCAWFSWPEWLSWLTRFVGTRLDLIRGPFIAALFALRTSPATAAATTTTASFAGLTVFVRRLLDAVFSIRRFGE